MAKFQGKRKFLGKSDGKAEKKKRKLTNFERYLQMDKANVRGSAEADAETEKRLAKLLKLKNGKTAKIGDNLDDLVGDDGEDDGEAVGDQVEGGSNSDDDGASDVDSDHGGSDVDSDHSGADEDSDHGEGDVDSDQSGADEDGEGDLEADGDGNGEPKAKDSFLEQQKYVPPHRKAAEASEDELRLKRRLKGLLNRMSEENVESITAEISEVYMAHPRLLVTELITGHVVDSCMNGPRGNEQYASVFASFSAGLAAMVGIDVGAYIIANVATSYEDACKKEDGLAARNLALLITCLYTFQALSTDLIYGFLRHLCERFSEIDVSTILHIIQSTGLTLRNADPTSMKEFILSVQKKSADLKKSYEGNENEAMSKRVEYMLEAICEVKNNKRRSKDEPPKHTRLKKWLQKLRVEEIQLNSLTWEKLLEPHKKGQWWQQAAIDSTRELPKLINAMDTGAAEAEKMLKLAASQRMNTDARRAIFAIVMSSEDYVDAFVKLLGLNMNGKQDREIVRVIVECCLQEKTFNKYYALLASKLCHHDRNYKFTLQYCAWDQFKELASMELRRSVNLAKFLASLVQSSALQLGVLRTVDFGDARVMTAKHVVHFRAFFEALFSDCSDEFIVTAFSRLSAAPKLSSLRDGMALFLRKLLQNPKNNETFVKRCTLARKALR